MNFNKNLWDETEAKEFGEFETLSLGGHAVKILNAMEYTSDISGKTSLKVSIDIDESDEQAGFFRKQFDKNTNSDKKWPSGATRYLSLNDEQLSYLKGFITSLEKSNPNFKFNTSGNWEQLKGLKCAGVFGLEEYTKEDGSIGTATKLTKFRSLDKLEEIKIPRVKLLDGTFVEYDEYKNQSKNNSDSSNFIEISADDLPF